MIHLEESVFISPVTFLLLEPINEILPPTKISHYTILVHVLSRGVRPLKFTYMNMYLQFQPANS